MGNILKGSESLFHTILKILREELGSSLITKAGAMLVKGAFQGMKNKPRRICAAPLLGLKGHVLRLMALQQVFLCQRYKNAEGNFQHDLIAGISKDIDTANQIIDSMKNPAPNSA